MDTPATSVENIFDEAGVIIADIHCRRCGYNVRGLREDGRCPECGTLIGLSTRGDLLRFADPTWVEKLALGVRYMLWGIVLSIIVSALGGCITGLTNAPGTAVNTIGLLSGLVGIYGAWLLTSPDPSRIGEDRYVTARKIVRIGLIAGLLSQVISIVLPELTQFSWLGVVFLGIPMILLGLVGVVAEFAKFLYIEKLADRIPNPKLAGFARFLRWAYSIGLAATVILGGLLLIGFLTTGGMMTTIRTAVTGTAPTSSPYTSSPSVIISQGGPIVVTSGSGTSTVNLATTLPVSPSKIFPGLVSAAIGTACLFGVAMLVFGIMVLVLYVKLGNQLRKQAEHAWSTWATDKPTAGSQPPPPLPEN